MLTVVFLICTFLSIFRQRGSDDADTILLRRLGDKESEMAGGIIIKIKVCLFRDIRRVIMTIEVCIMTCEEATGLIQVLKKIIGINAFSIPKQGSKANIDVVSVFSEGDRFKVDFNRSGIIKKEKYTLFLRYGKDQGLLRIDVGGPDHCNPDGTIVPCPHIHIQTHEMGMWDAWAYSLPAVFGDVQDRINTLIQFLKYCNVNNVDSISIYEQNQMG